MYRMVREKEHKRLEHMNKLESEIKADFEFEFKKRKLADEEESKTAKKRAKRQRQVSVGCFSTLPWILLTSTPPLAFLEWTSVHIYKCVYWEYIKLVRRQSAAYLIVC